MVGNIQHDDIKLSDVVDIDFLQELQDNFAKAMGMASITVDLEGPVTKPSNFTDFCINCTRKSELGYKRCNECDIKWGQIAAQQEQEVIYDCHTGLTDFAVPIVVNGRQLGSILGGQILTCEPDEQHFRNLAREFGLDEQEYIEALRKVKIIPREQVEAAAKILFLVANSISELAHKNLELKQKNKKETAFRKITEIIIKSEFDSKKLKEQLVKIIGEYFNADRCYFTEINTDTYAPYIITSDEEYLAAEDIKSIVGYDLKAENVKFFAQNHMNGKGIISIDYDKLRQENSEELKGIIEYGNAFGLKSGTGLPFFEEETLTSVLVLEYVKEKRLPKEDDIDFLKILGSQLGVLFNQIKLYETVHNTAKRETILRTVIEVVRSSLDINEVKKKITQEIGKAFNADRCYFRTYDKNKKMFLFPEAEHLLTSDIHKISDSEPDQQALRYFAEELMRRQRGFYPIIIDEHSAKGTAIEHYMKKFSIKADCAIPIVDNVDETLWIVFHYCEDPHFNNDDKNLLETIAFQIDIALNQLKLYSTLEKTAKRESLLRRINETISSTLNIDEVLSFICKEVTELFNIQRAIIVEFPFENNYSDYIIKKEYKTRKDIRSIREVDPKGVASRYWGEKIYGSNTVLAFDSIAESDAPEHFKNAYAEIGVKSGIGAAVKKDGKIWGEIVILEYDNYRHWSAEEITLLQTISNQIYISIQQSELYLKTKQQMEREKAIINNLPFLAWLKDKNGKFLAVNELFAKQCGLTPESMIGKTDYDIHPQDLAEKYNQDDINIMETGQPIKIEEQITGPDGAQWYETFKRAVFDENGIVIGTTGFARDITEQKEVDRMKNEFISIISHELRTPLTSIRGALGLVSSNTLGQLPDKVTSLLNIASNNTIRLINLINDILDMEKIKAGKMDFAYAEHELMPLIEETIKLNEEYARVYNVRFEIPKRLDNVIVNIDKDRLIQVITNLLSNAAKFSYQNEPVNVYIERRKSLIRVSITNKGYGIPEDSFSKIFQSFSQVDSSDARQKGGTGLGLNISKSIIEKMGGSIGFDSELNGHTTFYFELPEMHKDEDSKSVLICDDNKTSAYCIKSMFENIGYKADIALCADEASRLLDQKHYDMMTLDLILPDKPGLTLLDELKHNEATKDLPVLIISVKKPDLEVIKQNHQVVDWLEKSFDTNDLQSTIEKVMLKKNMHKINILHVENDTDILRLIDFTLRDTANIVSVKSITGANEILQEQEFDIIILDYVFPEGTSDKLIPTIKSGPNKDAKLIVFSAYEESKILSRYVDSIILKTNVSNEQFKESIQKLIDIKLSEKQAKKVNKL